MNEIIRVTELSQSFNGTKALDKVSFSLPAGERLAVLGPSGSGKTTLLRLVAGLEAPSGGEITLDGRPASRAGEVAIPPERRQVAMVFQGLALFPHLNALQQVAFAARGRGGLEQARSLLASIGLAHRADARLDQLSGGERQRIALARALAQEPKLLLMDEPFASLDDQKRAEMRELLRMLLEKRETTLILVTHSREDAFDLARFVLVLSAGKPQAFGPLAPILARPRCEAVVRTLGLGQLIQGTIAVPGVAQTAFGTVLTPKSTPGGPVTLLVRPGQPRIVAGPEGTEVEVVSVQLRSPETRQIQCLVVVRAGNELLHLTARERVLTVGERIRIRVADPCEPVDG